MTRELPLERVQHRSLVTGTDLTTSPTHGESRVNIEKYLEPLTALRVAALHGPGVATGLPVSATAGKTRVRLGTGVAIDRAGRTLVVENDGFAVTARNADGANPRNLVTVKIKSPGITVDTTGLSGERLLTLAWAEADVGGKLLRHAPWVQLLPAGDLAVGPDAVVLARVLLDAAGAVTSVTAGTRTTVTTVTDALRLRTLRQDPAPDLTVDHADAAELRARPDGGLDIVPPTAPGPALSIDGTGAVTVGGPLSVGTALQAPDTLRLQAPTAVSVRTDDAGTSRERLSISGEADFAYLTIGPGANGRLRTRHIDGKHHLDDTVDGLHLNWSTGKPVIVGNPTAPADLHVYGALAVAGGAGIGIAPGAAQRPLHVEGSEVHSGGVGGGFSFADRSAGGFRESPDAGQRWVWYADGGSARLWSGGNKLVVEATGAVTFTGDFGRPEGPATMSLAGSRIADVGDFVLSLRSGGNVVAFDGNDNVGIGTRSPRARLEVAGSLRALWGAQYDFPGWSPGGVGTHDIFATGAVYVGADPNNPSCQFYANGTKNFVIDHPTDPERRLVHACIEGPEVAVYYRGEGRLVDGLARVALPAYFEALVRDDGRTVQLTAVADLDEPIAALAATPVVDGAFTVRAATDVNPGQRFCWQVTGARADVEPLKVEIERRRAAVEEAMAHA